MGYSPWGCKELDMTERLSTAQHHIWERWAYLDMMVMEAVLGGSSFIQGNRDLEFCSLLIHENDISLTKNIAWKC